MVAVKAADVEGVLRRSDPRIGVFLVYGPDIGLVNERARTLAERSVDDAADPFQLIRIDGDDVAADPGRLADEAGTMGLFGGRRALWIRATSRNIAPAVDAVLKTELQDTAIVIEGGDLAKSSPLRTLCEKSPRALALPCYADTGRDLGAVVDEAMKAGGFSISREVRAAIVASLGGDRLATRGELAKLMLYAHGQQDISLDDVDAIMSDVSGLAMDAVVDAAFAGMGAELEIGSRRLAAEGIHASVVLGAALRHALTLLAARHAVEEGRSITNVIEGMRGLHFRRKPLVERQLQRWNAATLKDAVASIQDGILQTRRLAALGDVVTAKTLLDLARSARR
ncbi:DNA polymerase III subunit delta [Microvirga brassicacearum]|uniref:DNA polymerase III subunit delta n=1 Tax=Microvirga brassicacearum TaxID=2580413 RepID=A0A5N3PE32_9HYPH|nr:DNA polymerase III subunit delta [Microvirga brassicacearum]KAB0267986.1 DNA polymerase III subunit delta [Microvirga brassicacearum]